MCNCNNRTSLDITTPKNTQLSAFFKRSFAYRTVKNRLPAIITETIDTLFGMKDDIIQENGETAVEKLKFLISELYNLRTEMQENKSLRNIISDAPDAATFNECIQKQASEEGRSTYFHTVWLLTECYMYRRIWEAIERSYVLIILFFALFGYNMIGILVVIWKAITCISRKMMKRNSEEPLSYEYRFYRQFP